MHVTATSVYSGSTPGPDVVRRASAAAYAEANPFPHAVLHDVFDDGLLDRVLAEFPEPGSMGGQFNAADEVKSSENRWDRFGPDTQKLLAALNSAPFVDALEQLTGISGLITDHHFRGGGQHQIARGGHLGIHADFNVHRDLDLQRRLNVLVYLNHDWDDDWGGQLELWDTEMTECVEAVSPRFNTMVVFSTTSNSFHGHPDPLRTPSGVTRRSIATYYYTAFADAEAPDSHTTLFQSRPGSPKKDLVRQKLKAGTWNYLEAAQVLLPDGVVDRIRSGRNGSKRGRPMS